MDMNISIKIDAPELAGAIQALAAALLEMSKPVSESMPTPEPEPTPIAQFKPSPTAVPTTPISTSQPIPEPVITPAPPTTVPTTPQTYTMEQLAVAATQLVDAGRRMELVALLNSFGVQALTALPKEQYGAFATKLREMGAKI
ncbi:hypothetical protein D2962_05985 [Biomaibacter acetigenes]|uniref:rRNA biogenesis protein rrp5 n=1 Tax=Biomaibacter acetigenes TaxID=2316383 RepID=A0A3G2R5T4_9FIRM|nr:hypothetical protein [Biomaibacter acetigenes]AYO30227.1 hypothetical protein D2962_05985 [Biomaibacter acetigenes]